MRILNVGTQRLFRAVIIAALAAFLACGAVGLQVAPLLAGEAERDIQPTGKGVGEILKETKPVNPAGAETRPPCAPARDPWMECVSGQLRRCTQSLSRFGTALCNYRNRCLNSGHPC
jgi:hypothetical protein